MPKLPVISGEDLVHALRRGGFRVLRQRGSHVTLSNGRRVTVVPLHNTFAKGTLLGIMKQCELSGEDLLRLLEDYSKATLRPA